MMRSPRIAAGGRVRIWQGPGGSFAAVKGFFDRKQRASGLIDNFDNPVVACDNRVSGMISGGDDLRRGRGSRPRRRACRDTSRDRSVRRGRR